MNAGSPSETLVITYLSNYTRRSWKNVILTLVWVLGSKKVGLEGNTQKKKYMLMSGYQDAGKNHNMKTANK
jgi:hypothetical protein